MRGDDIAARAPVAQPARQDAAAADGRVTALERLVRWLDDGVGVPGTRVRFGLDAILGMLLPGAGDAVSGVASLAVLFAAVRARAPVAVLGRMLLNVAIDVVVGLVPVLGDAFDFVWHSNRMNLDLLERHRAQQRAGVRPRARVVDYLILGAAVLLVAAGVVLPLIAIGWIAERLMG